MKAGVGIGLAERLSRRVRALPWLVSGTPRPVLLVIGLACVGLGGLLLVRPLAAVTTIGIYIGVSCVVSGAGDLLSRRQDTAALRLLSALGWIVVGAVLLLWRGHTVGFLVLAVAFLLVVTGAARLIRAVSRQQLFAGIFGISEMVWGGLALAWPDVTLLVLAVLFGIRTVGFGLGQAVRALAPDRAPKQQPSPWGVVARGSAAVVSLLLAVGAIFVSSQFRDGVPVIDDFYTAPDPVPTTPGHLIRTEPYDGNLPQGMTGYRLLYSSTGSNGEPTVASAVLAVPTQHPGPYPVIAWAHGTVGVARACAPSLGADAISTTGIPALEDVVAAGWAVVATDYTGMGADGVFPYLVGTGQAYSVLDSIRASHQLPDTEFADAVIWGHSQGGHAALWTGQLAPSYAPELTLNGVATLSPAADPQAMAVGVAERHNSPATLLATAFVAASYSRTYEDLSLDEMVVPAALPLVHEAASRCTTDLATLVTLLSGLAISLDEPILQQDPKQGAMAERLAQNRSMGPWAMPVFLGHGTADEVIPVALGQEQVGILCATAPGVEAHFYDGRTHMSVLEADSALTDDLTTWTQARFDGEAATNDACR